MDGFELSCIKYYGTSSLYDIFGIKKTASVDEVRKTYYRMALIVHPDKVSDDKETAEEKFKILGVAYNILSDEKKREAYDATGSLDDVGIDSDQLRRMYNLVTIESIVEFEKSYKGSEEEENDLKKAYLKYKGNMDKILETVLFGDPEEEERYVEIINRLIESENLQKYKMDMSELARKRRKRKYETEKAEFEKQNKKTVAKRAELKLEPESDTKEDGMLSLMKAIATRQNERAQAHDALMTKLEMKYGKPGRTKKKSK